MDVALARELLLRADKAKRRDAASGAGPSHLEPSTVRPLLLAAKAARERLSLAAETTVALDFLPGCSEAPPLALRRAELEGLLSESGVLTRVLGPARSLLATIEDEELELDQLVLLGGLAATPAVQQEWKAMRGASDAVTPGVRVSDALLTPDGGSAAAQGAALLLSLIHI